MLISKQKFDLLYSCFFNSFLLAYASGVVYWTFSILKGAPDFLSEFGAIIMTMPFLISFGEVHAHTLRRKADSYVHLIIITAICFCLFVLSIQSLYSFGEFAADRPGASALYDYMTVPIIVLPLFVIYTIFRKKDRPTRSAQITLPLLCLILLELLYAYSLESPSWTKANLILSLYVLWGIVLCFYIFLNCRRQESSLIRSWMPLVIFCILEFSWYIYWASYTLKFFRASQHY